MRDECDGIDGTDGTNGTNGTDGNDGRGIASMSCNDEGQFVVTYTDGESQVIDGSSCVQPQP